jgi:hypothetical protein
MFEIDTVKTGKHMIDKSGAPLLAVGKQIEADTFLVMNAQCRGVVLRLFKFRAFEAKNRAAALVLCQPIGAGKTADSSRGDGRKLHGFTSD